MELAEGGGREEEGVVLSEAIRGKWTKRMQSRNKGGEVKNEEDCGGRRDGVEDVGREEVMFSEDWVMIWVGDLE